MLAANSGSTLNLVTVGVFFPRKRILRAAISANGCCCVFAYTRTSIRIVSTCLTEFCFHFSSSSYFASRHNCFRKVMFWRKMASKNYAQLPSIFYFFTYFSRPFCHWSLLMSHLRAYHSHKRTATSFNLSNRFSSTSSQKKTETNKRKKNRCKILVAFQFSSRLSNNMNALGVSYGEKKERPAYFFFLFLQSCVKL